MCLETYEELKESETLAYNELVHHFDAVQFPYDDSSKFEQQVSAIMKNGYTREQAVRSITVNAITY